MGWFNIDRGGSSPSSGKRSIRPRVESLEARLVLDSSLTAVTTLPYGSDIGDTNGPVIATGLTIDAQDNLFGAAAIPAAGGKYTGLIYELKAPDYSFTTLATLPTAPANLVVDANDNVYGTTADNNGTVFVLPAGSHTVSPLATFDLTNTGGIAGSMMLSGRFLYGTTEYGGNNGQGYGTVFAVPITGGTITTLGYFNGTNGNTPAGGLVLSGSQLFGTTAAGGQFGNGTVFSVPDTGFTPVPATVLASFSGPYSGTPSGNMIVSNGVLIGSTSNGPNSNGAIFDVPIGQPGITYSGFNGENGEGPLGGLINVGNKIVGITTIGGSGGVGELFSTTPGFGVDPLDAFDHHGASGHFPITTPVVDSHNNVFGLSQSDNVNQTIVWKYSGLSNSSPKSPTPTPTPIANVPSLGPVAPGVFNLWTGNWSVDITKGSGSSGPLANLIFGHMLQGTLDNGRSAMVSAYTENGQTGVAVGYLNKLKLSGSIVDPVFGTGTFTLNLDPKNFHTYEGTVSFKKKKFSVKGELAGPYDDANPPEASLTLDLSSSATKVSAKGKTSIGLQISENGGYALPADRKIGILLTFPNNAPADILRKKVVTKNIARVGRPGPLNGVTSLFVVLDNLGPLNRSARVVIPVKAGKAVSSPGPLLVATATVQGIRGFSDMLTTAALDQIVDSLGSGDLPVLVIDSNSSPRGISQTFNSSNVELDIPITP